MKKNYTTVHHIRGTKIITIDRQHHDHHLLSSTHHTYTVFSQEYWSGLLASRNLSGILAGEEEVLR